MSGTRGRGARLARSVRIAAAAAVLVLAVSGFFSAESGGVLPRIVPALQLFPAAARIAVAAAGGAALSAAAGGAALSAAAVALFILLFSAVFGRWYCAALCPLGTLQDIASFAGGRKRRSRAQVPALRYAVLAVVLGLAFFCCIGIASWLEPWTLFGRFVAYDLQPIVLRVLRVDSPGLEPWIVVSSALATAFVLVASALSGRWFCGNLCPVGAALGALNRFAPFRLRLDASSCVSCGRCSSVCPASCVDGAGKELDPSRCVYCLSCLPACPTGALRYGRENGGTAPSAPGRLLLNRSRFLAALGSGAVAFAVASRKGGLFRAAPSPGPGGAPLPVTPPGSRSHKEFVEKCTACGLCVARCPAKILRPSVGQLGAAGILVPRIDYGVSYCQYECTACLDVCPSGALAKLSPDIKKLTKIGNATLIRERCVVVKNRTRCGACAEHCPTGAVRMIVGGTGLPEPVFDSAICIGCGACHHACPVEGEKAISVSGLAVHETAELPSKNLFDAPAPAPADEDEFPF